jgi:hypothetical protein
METGRVIIERGNEYYSMHNNLGLEYYAAYNELIDNAIDNNATEIVFETTENSVTITDNGTGIKDTMEDMQRVLRMHRSSNIGNSSKIGEYGVGLKDATMRLGKGIFIKSKAPGCRAIEIDVPWKEINYEEGAKFRLASNGGDEQGTAITIFFDEEDTKKIPAPSRTSFKYYDKLIKAKKLNITTNDKVYEPYIDPVFEGEAKTYNNISFKGKQFDVKIGILSKSINSSLSGFYVYSNETLRYYQVADASLDGSIDAKDGLYVSIGLHGIKRDWPVDKNKRGIMNIDIVADYLDANNDKYLGFWKAKLYNSKKVEKLTAIEQELAPYFGLTSTTIGEEKRNKGGSCKGTIEPVGTGKKREEAARVAQHLFKRVMQKGGIVPKGLNITDGYFDKSKYLSIGRDGKELVVRMNRNNKFISDLLLNKSVNTIDVLKVLINLALKTNIVPENEIKYGLVDQLFTEHYSFEPEEVI